jgi:hypothetical protein
MYPYGIPQSDKGGARDYKLDYKNNSMRTDRGKMRGNTFFTDEKIQTLNL